MWIVARFVVALSCGMLALDAQAQASPWTLRVGPAHIGVHESARVEVAGRRVAGAEIAVEDSLTAALEIGYAIDPVVTLRFLFGAPPTTTLTADGSLKRQVPPLSGTLGRVSYGPAALTLTYAFGKPGSVRPYAGAGLHYTAVLRSSDGDVASLEVKNAYGPVLQAGLDIPLGTRWSLFVDARKMFVKVKARGTLPALGGPPARAEVTLNPLVLHAGVGYRF